jgi:hypothetical protein
VAQNVTIATVRENARLYADQRPGTSSTFVSDPEVDRLIHQAIRGEFYDLLVAARGHEYFETVASLTTVAGASTIDLPSDHYEFLSLFILWSATEAEPIDQLDSIDDRDQYIYPGANWARETPKAFRLRGSVIELFPTPNVAQALELRYVPTYSEASVFDAVNGWDKLVSLAVARELLIIQKLPTSQLQELYDETKQRVEMLAADRVASKPARVRDVVGYEDPRRRRRNWRYHGMPS